MTVYLGSTYATYNYYTKNSEKAVALQAADSQTANATAYYEANIGKVKTVDEFVNDYRLFNYAMTAYGLSEMAHAKAYMVKVLNSDLSDKGSFANKLSDTKFANFAKAFANLNPNEADPSTTASTQTVVKAYMEQSIESSLGEVDEGVQLALYFKRTAPTVKSAFGLLADGALWKVASTVFGLPASLGSMDTDTQKRIVESKVDVADFQDPEKLDRLLARFTAVWDATENAASSPILALFGVQTGTVSNKKVDGVLGLF